MPVTRDIYGNADPFSMFYDYRTNAYAWYPTSYLDHPEWSQYLVQVRNIDLPRPAGMHGGSAYPTVSNLLYPGQFVFPSSTTFTGSN